MVPCRCNRVISRLVNMQFSVSLHSDTLWRTSVLITNPIQTGSTIFTSQSAPAPQWPALKPAGPMVIAAVRGGLLPAERSSAFQQPWDRRGEVYLQGARFMGSSSVVRWFRKMRSYQCFGKTRRRPALKKVSSEKELELDVKICLEEELRKDEEILVHGLLHLLGYDHEKGDEAEIEMEKEEEVILKSLGWKGKGLIHSSYENFVKDCSLSNTSQEDSVAKDPVQRKDILQMYRPKFKYLFCDMDGTVLNSQSQITSRTAEALKEAISRGVKIMIATGKTRPAVISALKMVDLAGENGVVSKFSPGVFLQGLLVYGKRGCELYRRNLDPEVCKEPKVYLPNLRN